MPRSYGGDDRCNTVLGFVPVEEFSKSPMTLFVYIPSFLLLVISSWYTFSEAFSRSIQKRVEAKTEELTKELNLFSFPEPLALICNWPRDQETTSSGDENELNIQEAHIPLSHHV